MLHPSANWFLMEYRHPAIRQNITCYCKTLCNRAALIFSLSFFLQNRLLEVIGKHDLHKNSLAWLYSAGQLPQLVKLLQEEIGNEQTSCQPTSVKYVPRIHNHVPTQDFFGLLLKGQGWHDSLGLSVFKGTIRMSPRFKGNTFYVNYVIRCKKI